MKLAVFLVPKFRLGMPTFKLCLMLLIPRQAELGVGISFIERERNKAFPTYAMSETPVLRYRLDGLSRSQAPLGNAYLQALLDVVNCSCHAKRSLVVGVTKLEFGNEIHDFHSSHRSSVGTHPATLQRCET
jgi:hypothetical protein